MSRLCLYCQKDISEFAHNRIICNSILCRRKRDIEVRKLPKLIRNCIFCGKNISNLRRDAKICHSLSCRNNNSIETYKKRLKDKICIYCHATFKGRDNELQCSDCADKKYKCASQHRAIIRREIYLNWTKHVMARDNFRCIKCNTHSNLEVHHLLPLREITNDVLKSFNLSNLFLIDINSNLFQSVLLEILNRHTVDIGIMLCKFCHAEVDNKRHVKT